MCLTFLAASALALPQAPAPSPPAGGPVFEYVVRIEDPASEKVHVRASFRGLPEGMEERVVALPEAYSFARLPEPRIEGELRATGEDAELEVRRVSPFSWSVAAAGDFELELTVPHDHRRQPAVVEANDQFESPYVAADHAMLVPATLLPAPRDVEGAERIVRFELPEGWPVLSSWRLGEDGGYRPDEEELHHDALAVGSWSARRFRAGEADVTLAFAPGQDELEGDVAEILEEIVVAEQELFGLTPQPRYLFLFCRPDTRGFGGSPSTSSMKLNIGQRLSPKLMRLHIGHLVAHEYHHTWARALYHCPDELRFFSEGFTDYYAWLLLARLGYSTWEEFAGKLAETLGELSKNPAAGASLEEAGGPAFFEGRDHYHLVYHGGLVLAAWLDRAVRAKGGKSLDDLMRAFNNDGRWARGETAPDLEDLVACVREHTDEVTAEKLRAWAAGPWSAFDAPAAFASVGAGVEREEREDGVVRYVVDPEPWRGHAE